MTDVLDASFDPDVVPEVVPEVDADDGGPWARTSLLLLHGRGAKSAAVRVIPPFELKRT